MQGSRILWTMALAAALAAGSASVALAQIATEDEVKAKVESEGYRNVRDVKFGPEGITLKATKDGGDRLLVMDSTGRVIEQK